MKKVLIILAVALMCLPIVALCEEDQPADTAAVKAEAAAETQMKADKDVPPAPAEYLIGEWTMNPTKTRISGYMIFNANGTYERMETDPDGSGGGVKGNYKLYADQTPCGIDLCLGECDRDGSEWTTMFGIVRLLDDGRVEILTSPDSNRPEAFGDEPDEQYTRFLTRKVQEEEKK